MKRRFLLAAALSTTAFSWFERLVAPSSELIDPYWQSNNAASTNIVDHQIWDAFLSTYVQTDAKSVNRVSYGAVTAEDRNALQDYLDKLQRVEVTQLNRDEQLAYWINLYNAQTIAVVLDHYPVESIRDIKFGKTFAIGPWGEPLVTVEGRDLSLNDIEHGIVRPVFNEPRIHYALNCAASGCPNLQMMAFTAASLEAMLDAGARAYVNDSRGVRFDANGDVILSSIYNWFAIDFGAFEPEILEHIRSYASSELRDRLKSIDNVSDYAYDWSLNEWNKTT